MSVAKLTYTDGGVEREFVLDVGRASYSIGRNPMCDLRVNNPSMSRKHAEIRLDAASGTFTLVDLASSNGTFVNGAKVASVPLSDGDRIICGEFPLVFVEQTSRAMPSASMSVQGAANGVGSTKRKSTFSGLPTERAGTDPRRPASSELLNRIGGANGNSPVASPDGSAAAGDGSPSNLELDELVASSEGRRTESVSGAGSSWGDVSRLDSQAGVVAQLERLKGWLSNAEAKIVQLEADNRRLSDECDALRDRERELVDVLRRASMDMHATAARADAVLAGTGKPE
jgi:predicted component of type VI protein secretion system